MERSTSPKPPEMHDMCVGTSVGTITEPECLGPCEPGTTVTLEGIVWQETEGGKYNLLVVDREDEEVVVVEVGSSQRSTRVWFANPLV